MLALLAPGGLTCKTQALRPGRQDNSNNVAGTAVPDNYDVIEGRLRRHHVTPRR